MNMQMKENAIDDGDREKATSFIHNSLW